MPVAHKPVQRRSCDPGICWPSNGIDTATTVGDPFGHRTFGGHASGVDFHRGIDLLDNVDGSGEMAGKGGAPVYSPVNGCVIRRHYSWFQWDDDGNLTECTEVDTGSKATFSRSGSNLVIVGKNNGTVTFPSGLARLEGNLKFNPDQSSGDWILVWTLPSTPSAFTGNLVMGIYDADNSEYAALEYNGSTFTVKGKDSGGVMAADGTTATPSGQKWARILMDSATGTLYWQYSNTGSQGSWTTIASEGTITWTKLWPALKAFIGWDPAASGGDTTVNVDMWGYGDVESITRFGNWIEVAREDLKFLLFHMRHISASVGAVVRAGQQVGITGKTGADNRSGVILQNHVHVEYITSDSYIYSNTDPLNALAALPRTDGTSNVTGVLSSATYPGSGGGDSWKLAITVTRSTQDFDENQFQLVGNLATRTLNWNTRSGLDPSDNDTVEYNSVYFEPVDFDETSGTYQINLYYKKTVVGSSTPTWSVRDINGTLLASG